MSGTPKIDLAEHLPAGEWADIHVLTPAGLMAHREWAVFARARWLRGGGKPAFVKFVVPAGSGAGDTSVVLTGSPRLARLKDRLLALRALETSIPLVPLLDVQLTEEGLLIAMEEVTPLQSLIERGLAYDLSVRLLRDLDPEKPGAPRWLHFDICPQNIGVLSSGRCVFIDVDSMYLEDQERFDVSAFVWKPFRAPQQLEDEVAEGCRAQDIGRDIANRKVRFEVALAAAECILGPIPPRRSHFDQTALDTWGASADTDDPAVRFWLAEMQSALVTGDTRPIAQLASELANIMAAPRSTSARDSRPEYVSPDMAAAVEHSTPPGGAPAQAGWATDWLLLRPAAHALRAGKLDRDRVSEYRSALERLCTQYPGQRDAWEELLLVAITYEKDAAGALATVERALDIFPNDHELCRLKQIIQNWRRERAA